MKELKNSLCTTGEPLTKEEFELLSSIIDPE